MFEVTEPDVRQPGGSPEPRQRNDRLLVHLLSNVNRARADVRASRGNPGSSIYQRQRFAVLAGSLEAYAAEAAACGAPIPYRYRDEMRLYRSMAVDPRAGRFGSATQ
jgi:hypothetical protein